MQALVHGYVATPSRAPRLVREPCLSGGRNVARPSSRSRRWNFSSIRGSSKVHCCILASSATQESQASNRKWILEPTGDGNCSHLGDVVPLPGAFELSEDSATVGRVEGKADIVIPVGTVSGLHARLEKKGALLLVTDLDSTNGTYVENKRLRPGAVTPVTPGSSIVFGDEHLAQYKFSIVEEA